jgi:hydrogenase nickel incorporation protein HypB
MCEHCGCQANDLEHDHHHEHLHEHGHSHAHSHKNSTGSINIETDILQKNNMLAQRNRGYFEAKNIRAFNLVSSPGSGKTAVLECTIKSFREKKIYVIEGDQQTSLDADRILSGGAPVIQINTGNGCHLDAEMVFDAVKKLDPANNSLLFIENVGNLVCPALFDLGENDRVVIISVTEGDDKPLKYPNMFQTARLCLINKIDLLPYVDFDLEQCKANALKVNSGLKFISLSAKTSVGFPEWLAWIQS